MTKTEIFQRLAAVIDVTIQAHVQLNTAMDMLYKLQEEVRQDIVLENERK